VGNHEKVKIKWEGECLVGVGGMRNGLDSLGCRTSDGTSRGRKVEYIR